MMKSLARLAGLLLANLFLMAVSAAAIHPSTARSDDGKEEFGEAGCNMCHAVSSAGIEAKVKSGPMKGPDLTNIHKRRNADWIKKYLRMEVKIDGKAHKKEFKGSDEELQAIVDWLLEQKSE